MTGLIYVVIIALWAAVLIPIWLRRHDQISETRSTARFSSAMRSLGSSDQRRYATDTSSVHPEDLAVTRRDAAPEARMATRTTRPAEGLDPSYERELVRQAAATRRAVVLGALTALLLLVLLLAVAGMVPKWAPALAALPVIGFVAAASMTASQRSEKPARHSAARRTDELPIERSVPAVQSDDDWETWNAWDDDDSWEAVETTLPTYVNAPRASQVPRRIDRSRPGEWTGEAMVETAQAMRTRPRSAPLADPADIDHGATTAEIPVVSDQPRRAVNE